MWQARWAQIRDVASWALGAWWGQLIMADPGPADPWKISLVATLLGLPFAFRADALRRGEPERPEVGPGQSMNGTDVAPKERQ